MSSNETELKKNEYRYESGLTAGGLTDTKIFGEERYTCKLCSNKYLDPRVLSCLHVFCQDCLNKLADETGDSKAEERIIVCPQCQQDTKVKNSGAACLPRDHVTINILNSSEIETKALLCTSCDSDLLAMAKCWDCEQYLCAYCYSAHQTLRCFKDHHAVDFADICTGTFDLKGPARKPIFCDSHVNEKLTFFCSTCEAPMCNICALSDNPAHHLSRKPLDEALPQQRERLENLFEESKEKARRFYDKSSFLEKTLFKIQEEYDNAEKRILGLYEIYKASLEDCREESLQELKRFRTEKEFILTVICQNLQKSRTKIDDACKFTSQLLRHGNAVEILALENVVSTQLVNINNQPEPNINLNVKFDTTVSAFKNAVKATFAMSSTEEMPEGPIGQGTVPDVQQDSIEGDSGMSLCSGSPLIGECSNSSDVNVGDVKMQMRELQLVLKFGRRGKKAGEFISPRDLCLDWNGDILVADTGNHRVQRFDRNGVFISEFGGRDGRLLYPRRIAAFPKSDKLVVGDRSYHLSRLQIFTKDGLYLRKISTANLVGILTGLNVTEEENIVIVDKCSACVFVMSAWGEILHRLEARNYVVTPSDVIFWNKEFYVCDLRGHAVVVFGADGTFKRSIGWERAKWLPSRIGITHSGYILVGYSYKYRLCVAAFSPGGEKLSVSQCPGIKVDRCLGLKLTQEEHAVTLCRKDEVSAAVLIVKKL